MEISHFNQKAKGKNSADFNSENLDQNKSIFEWKTPTKIVLVSCECLIGNNKVKKTNREKLNFPMVTDEQKKKLKKGYCIYSTYIWVVRKMKSKIIKYYVPIDELRCCLTQRKC